MADLTPKLSNDTKAMMAMGYGRTNVSTNALAVTLGSNGIFNGMVEWLDGYNNTATTNLPVAKMMATKVSYTIGATMAFVTLYEMHPVRGRIWTNAYNNTWGGWKNISDGGNAQTAQTLQGFSFNNTGMNGTPNYVPAWAGGTPTAMGMYAPAQWTVGGIAGGSRSTAATITLSDWVRTTGGSGWFNETYGGGINMEDTTWIRAYNNKKFYVSNGESSALHTAGGIHVNGNVSGSNIAALSHARGYCGFPTQAFYDMYCNGNYRYSDGSGMAVYTPDNWGRVARLTYSDKDYIEFYNSTWGAKGVFMNVSDISLKNSIIPTKINALDDINKIKLYDFYWNSSNKHQSVGFLSQQLQTVREEYVVETKDDNDIISLMPYTPEILPLAIKAIQELNSMVDVLKNEIELLKKEVKLLKGE